MRFLKDRRTSPDSGRSAGARRPHRAIRGAVAIEVLESRRLLSTLDIVNGNLVYSESYSGVTNHLSITSTGTPPTYTIVDQVETISISSIAQSLGWSGDGTHVATGPAASVTALAIDATNQDSDLVVNSIDNPATVTGFQSVVVGGAVGGGTASLQGIRQSLNVVNSGGQTLLVLNDAGTTTPQGWSVLTNSVSGPLPAQVTFNPAQISQLGLAGGSGGNTFSVNDTGAPTIIDAGTGIDFVGVVGTTAPLAIDGQGTGVAGSTDNVTVAVSPGIAGAVSIQGTTGTTALTLDDTDNVVARAGIVRQGSVSGYTPQPVTFNLGTLSSLDILGGAGTDDLTVDFSVGNAIPSPGGLTYDGGAGSNSLKLVAGGFINERITASGPGAGTINLDGSTVLFRNLSPVFDLSPAVNFRLDAPIGSNTINIVNGPSIGVATTEVNSGDTPARFELVDFANKANVTITAINDSPIGNEAILLNNAIPAAGMSSLAILTGDTDDTVNVQASPPGVATSIDAAGGNDVVSFFAPGLGAGGSDSVNGGQGTNTLNVNSAGGLTTFSATSIDVSGHPSIVLSNFAQANISNAGDPPLIPVPSAIKGTIGVPLTDVVAGSFDDSDPRGRISNFTATINWGDGTPPTTGTVTQPGGPGTRFNVLGTHTYTTAGNFAVVVNVVGTANTTSTVLGGTTFNVSDLGGATTTINSSASIPSPSIAFTPIPATAIEDVPFTGPLVTISTKNFRTGTFTATIGWGDGTAPSAGTVVAQPNGTFVVNGSHTYLRESNPGAPYPVTVHITDPTGVTTDVSTTATVLSNDIVTSVADSGPGSLRAVILDVNADQIPTAIRFNIPGAGPHRIAPTSPLPAINFPVVIDGRTQPGFGGAPVVELSGGLAGAAADGLTLAGGASTVQALVINGFGGSGLVLEGVGGNRVEGNRIGTDVSGTRAIGNGDGIDIVDVGRNVIGGTTAAERNLISGNRIVGLRLSCNGATGNRIQGNFIGTDVTGTGAVPNFQGVFLLGSPRNLVGGSAPGAGNVISGNISAGVQIFNDATVFNGQPLCNPPGVATGNVLQGNRIGTNAAGTARLGNSQGVFVNDASSNLIGGSTPGAANLIAGNRSIGIQVLGDHATGNAILGNFIGTNAARAGGLGNNVGVYIYAKAGNVVGLGLSPGANTIASNPGGGVRIRPLSQGPSVERVGLFPAAGPITRIVVTFTTYMNRQRILNPNNYVITPLGRNSQPGPRVPVVNVVYNEVYRLATLTLATPLARNSTFRFRVVGTSPNGLTDRAGNFLNGTPRLPRQSTGTDFEATVSRGVVRV